MRSFRCPTRQFTGTFPVHIFRWATAPGCWSKFGWASLICLLAGCASPARQGRGLPEPVPLARQLNALTGDAAPEESQRLAETVIRRSQELSVEYRSVQPAWAHNLLVRTGFRNRGLCYEWLQDLNRALVVLELKHFTLHWGVARPRTLREHNALVVTACERPFAEGIVLDPWRKSGRLHWVAVGRDDYNWTEKVDTESVERPVAIAPTSDTPASDTGEEATDQPPTPGW